MHIVSYTLYLLPIYTRYYIVHRGFYIAANMRNTTMIIACVWRSLCVSVLVLLCAAPPVLQATIFSSPEPWRWVHFTAVSGIPSTDVKDLCETPSGTVWVTTTQGLAWYNGFFWTAIDSTSGLPSVPIKRIFPLADDTILVHIDNRLYTGTTDGFRPFAMNAAGTTPPIRNVAPLSNDSLVILLEPTLQQPLQLYSNNTLSAFPLPQNVQRGSERIKRLYCTNRQTLWLATTAGLYRFTNATWQKIYSFEKKSESVTHIIENIEGQGYFFVEVGPKRGFWNFTREGAIHYTAMGDLFSPVSMDIAPNGDVTVAYFNGLVHYYNGKNWQLMTPAQTETIGISFVHYRANGDVWLATPRQFSLYRQSSNRWTYHDFGYASANNYINEIVRARNGTLWAGTGNGLQIKYPGKPWKSLHTIQGIELRGITGLAEDGDGNIWVGSGASFEGAFRWDGSAWKHFTASDGLAAERVHKIRIDRKGRPWFLTIQISPGISGNGAFVYDNGKFSQWDTTRGLLNNRVYSFVETSDGAYWFGTLTGISRWHKGMWKHWRSTPGKQDRIYALAADSSGRVWYSFCLQGGIGYIEHESLHPVSLLQSELSIPAEQPVALELQVDSHNRVWVTTQGHGLYCYHNGIVSNFQMSTGLQSINLWPIIPTDDQLYIGTVGRGINILSLHEENNPLPKVRFGTPLIEENRVMLYWQAFSFWGQMPYDDIETRYRIDSDNWSPWAKHNHIELNNMSSGTHTLSVQAKGLFATYTPTPYTTTFIIPPPLYQRPLFLAIFAVLATIVLWFAGSSIRRKQKFHAELRRLNTELEQKVRDRTLKFVEANKQLQEEIIQRTRAEENLTAALLKEKELSNMKSRFVSTVSHEFRTPLSIILSSADLLDYYTDKLSETEKQKYHQRIKKAVEHVIQLMNNALFIEKANSNKIVIRPVELALHPFCTDIIAELATMYNDTHRIRYVYEGSSSNITADSELMRLILIHLLSNALQYSPSDTPIDFTVTAGETTLTLVVADKGDGIPPDDMDKIPDTFHRGANAEMIPGTGLGLAIVHNCVQLHKGTIHIDSNNQGTTITVSLPTHQEQSKQAQAAN